MKEHLKKINLNQSALAIIFFMILNSCTGNFETIETSFNSGNLKMSARIYKPIAVGEYPAVVIVHGSEPDTKDHYKEYSEKYSQNGIVVLTYDKRGVGKSEGNLWKSSLDDLADDALAGLNHLRQFDFVDTSQCGLWGISQGGWILTKAAKRSQKVKFLICVSAPAMSPSVQNEFYITERILRNGGTKEYADQLSQALNEYMRFLVDSANLDSLNLLIDKVKNHPLCSTAEETSYLEFLPDEVSSNSTMETVLMNPAGRNYFYNPIPDWRSLSLPMIFFYGGADDQVPGKRCFNDVQSLNKSNITAYYYPNANHGLREYFLLGDRFPEGYLERQIEWLRKFYVVEN